MATLGQEYNALTTFTPLPELRRLRRAYAIIERLQNKLKSGTRKGFVIDLNAVFSAPEVFNFIKKENLPSNYFGSYLMTLYSIPMGFNNWQLGQVRRALTVPKVSVAVRATGRVQTGSWVGRAQYSKVTTVADVAYTKLSTQEQIANLQRHIASKLADIKRIKESEARAAATRKRELELGIAQTRGMQREAKALELMRKQQEEQAKLLSNIADARTREKQRSEEIAAAREREARLLEDIAEARKREAAEATAMVGVLNFQLSKDKNKLRIQTAIAGKKAALATQTAALSNEEERLDFIEETKFAKASNLALMKQAATSGRGIQEQIATAQRLVFDLDQIIKTVVFAKVKSKSMILDAIAAIKKADKQALGTFGEDIFEKNRKGWIEALRVEAMSIPDPEVKEAVMQQVQVITPKKKRRFLPFILLAGAAAYVTTQ